MSVPYRFWHSAPEGLNTWGYASPAVDAALDALRHAPDDETFRRAAREFEHAMMDDPPAIFLAWNERARAVSRRFYVPQEPGVDILRTMAQWRLAAVAR